MQTIYLWLGISMFLLIVLVLQIIFLILLSKKTHGIIEFVASFKRLPIGVFFDDNNYLDWKVLKPDAGLIEDKKYGSFVINSTYIDKKTKNVLIPFLSSFAMSLNVKAVKLADDLMYVFKEQFHRKQLKEALMKGNISESDGMKTLRTSVNFSSVKHFVSPILPHSIQSKIVNTVALRMRGIGVDNFQNIVLLVISVLGALVMGGIMLKIMLGK